MAILLFVSLKWKAGEAHYLLNTPHPHPLLCVQTNGLDIYKTKTWTNEDGSCHQIIKDILSETFLLWTATGGKEAIILSGILWTLRKRKNGTTLSCNFLSWPRNYMQIKEKFSTFEEWGVSVLSCKEDFGTVVCVHVSTYKEGSSILINVKLHCLHLACTRFQNLPSSE